MSEHAGYLLVFVAHPDDESFGCGSVIAEAVARGCRVAVCTASLGEEGEVRSGFDLGDRALAEVRHDELRAAAAVLGADTLAPLGLRDSGWDGPAASDSICGTDLEELTGRLQAVLTEHQPDAVLTIAGDDGHRDHRRLCEAVDVAFSRWRQPAAVLYHWCLPNSLMRRWAEEMTRLRPETAHLALEVAALGTRPEQITTTVDVTRYLARRRRAIAAHASQVSPYEGLSDELATAFLSTDHLIRLDSVPAIRQLSESPA